MGRIVFYQMRPDFTAMNGPQEMARMMALKTGQEYMLRKWANPKLPEMYKDLLNVAQAADFMFAGEGVTAAALVAEKLGMRWASSAIGTSRTIPRKQYSASRVAKGLSELLDHPSYAPDWSGLKEAAGAEFKVADSRSTSPLGCFKLSVGAVI